jgi:hypothetical protein
LDGEIIGTLNTVKTMAAEEVPRQQTAAYESTGITPTDSATEHHEHTGLGRQVGGCKDNAQPRSGSTQRKPMRLVALITGNLAVPRHTHREK